MREKERKRKTEKNENNTVISLRMVSCFHSSGKCYKTRKKSTLNLWIVVNRKKMQTLSESQTNNEAKLHPHFHLWAFVSSMSNFSDFKLYISIYPTNVTKCPATLRWALSWENTDDFCHIYTIYIYIYIYAYIIMRYNCRLIHVSLITERIELPNCLYYIRYLIIW